MHQTQVDHPRPAYIHSLSRTSGRPLIVWHLATFSQPCSNRHRRWDIVHHGAGAIHNESVRTAHELSTDTYNVNLVNDTAGWGLDILSHREIRRVLAPVPLNLLGYSQLWHPAVRVALSGNHRRTKKAWNRELKSCKMRGSRKDKQGEHASSSEQATLDSVSPLAGCCRVGDGGVDSGQHRRWPFLQSRH